MKKTNRKYAIIVGAIFLAFVIFSRFSEIYTEFLWFDELGFDGTFWTIYLSEYVVGIIFFAIFCLVAGINVSIALGSTQTSMNLFSTLERTISAKFIKLVFAGIIAFFGYIMAKVAAANWIIILRWMDKESFNLTDPIFNNDISLYVFSYPFYSFLNSWLFGTVVITIILTLITYVYKEAIRFQPKNISFSPNLVRHIIALFAVIFLLYIWDYWLSAYEILFQETTRNSALFGAGYTDVKATLFSYRIMTIIMIVNVIIAILGSIQRKWKYLGIAFGTFIGGALILTNLYPSIVQKFSVKPNELEKEMPYLRNSIDFTRQAYGLDKIEEVDFNIEYQLDANALAANPLTVKNITLWDTRPLKDAYDQLQEIKPYYDFSNVDIDRYYINGEYRQVMLSPREINLSKFRQQSWINQTFIYTHGYGVVMNPVNVVVDEGLPNFFINNIPPESNIDIDITRPEIYFGELTNHYVILHAKNTDEFDYPIGDKNEYTRYEESAGISIGGFWRKLMFALKFNSVDIFLTDEIDDQSRIMFDRNITHRVNKIAGKFLMFDADPYVVVENGRMYWIYDAYTTSKHYPYSEPVRNFNYIRNSVKVVIDAYNGETTFYVINREDDPVIQVYENIFPDLFVPIDQMPDNLRKHVRYGKDLFTFQTEVYSTYHMADTKVFYNKEDLWQVANELYAKSAIKMESYYIIMKLPDAEKEELILMIPYTPANKDNMLAWMCARSDGENYGKLLVYRFPKNELIYGPQQIEARIDQTPDISEQLTLWNQQGSKVTRGNLLVIPINQSLLYVEPLYIQAEQGRIPELKKVIVAYENRVVMEDNLDIGLQRVFGYSLEEDTFASGVGQDATDLVSGLETAGKSIDASIRNLSKTALGHYTKAQEYLKAGDWANYGEELERLEKILRKLVVQIEQ